MHRGDKLSVTIESRVKFRNNNLNDIFSWYINNVLNNIWFDSKFQRCAKGGTKFPKKFDMPYISHILSGAGLVLKVIDIGLNEEKFKNIEDLDDKIKKALIGFTFHDFNKLTETSFKLDDQRPLEDFLENLNFKELLNSYQLDYKDIYEMAIFTEIGTSGNIFGLATSKKISQFEKEIIRVADELSSIYNDQGNLNHNIMIGDFMLYNDKIHNISLSSTIYYSLTSLLKISLIEMIEEKGCIYLWSTPNTIFYYGNSINFQEFINQLVDKIYDLINVAIEPSNFIEFSDRKIFNPVSGLIEIKEEDIDKLVCDNEKFKKIIYMENKEINSTFAGLLQKYKDEIISRTKSISFNLSYNKNNKFSMQSLFDFKEVGYFNIEEIKERKKIFVIRVLQLEGSEFSSEARKIMNNVLQLIESYKDSYMKPFFDVQKGINQRRSATVIPIALALGSIDDDEYSEVLRQILKKWNDNIIDIRNSINKIISIILNFGLSDIPDVPSKEKIAIISGYPSSKVGLGENTYGIPTNSMFTNKIITSRSTTNYKIDDLYMIEALVRKDLIMSFQNDSQSTILHLTFPGAIPYLDLYSLFSDINQQKVFKKHSKLTNDRINKLIINLNPEQKTFYLLGNTIQLNPGSVKSSEDIISLFDTSLALIELTKMRCLITDSHNPPIIYQRELFRIETKEFILKDLGWDKLRCDQIETALRQLDVFKKISSFSKSVDFKEVSNVIRDFIAEPFSLFYYIRKIYLSDKSRFGYFRRIVTDQEFNSQLDYLIRFSKNQEPKRGEMLEKIRELAEIAYKLNPRPGESTNERTWMLRESLYALEKMTAETDTQMKKNLENYREIISGVIYKGLQRDNKKWVDNESIDKFSESLISLLKEYYGGRIPTGSMRSYITDAFEYEYLKHVFKLNSKEGEKK